MATRNGVQRTLGELSASLTDIGRRLDDHKTSIEALGNRFEHALEKHADEDHQDFDAVEQRLLKVEKHQNRLLGKLAVSSLLIGGFTSVLVQVVLRRFLV